jgi:hypothetical protein
MGAKAENLNSVIENQNSDLNLQVAWSHTLTRRTRRAFKSGKANMAGISLQCKGIAGAKTCAEGGDCV